MKRSGPLRRRSPLRARRVYRPHPDPATNARYREICATVRTRALWLCEARIPEVCTRAGEHCHHVWLRSRGGPDTVENLLFVCRPCHDFIHAHPGWAKDAGFMRSAPAA